jgi:hypothetical protein
MFACAQTGKAAEMSEQRDVIEVLEHDHLEVEEMFDELESLRGDPPHLALAEPVRDPMV